MERTDEAPKTLVLISTPPQHSPTFTPGTWYMVETDEDPGQFEDRINDARSYEHNLMLHNVWYCQIRIETKPGERPGTMQHAHIVNVTPLTMFDSCDGHITSIPILEDTQLLFPTGNLREFLLSERERRQNDLREASARRSGISVPQGAINIKDFRRPV